MPIDVPPHDDLAERQVVGAVLLSEEAYAASCQVIQAEDFYSLRHQLLFQSLGRLIDQGLACDPVSLASDLEQRGVLEDAGGASYCIDLMQELHHAAHVITHSKRVRELSLLRKIRDACADSMRRATKKQTGSDVILVSLVEQLTQIGQENLSSLSQTVPEIMKDIEAQADDDRPRVPVGLEDLDAEIQGGAMAGDLVVVGARPSMGKTVFGLQWAHTAAMHGIPATFYSTEMTNTTLIDRVNPARLQSMLDVPLRSNEKCIELGDICNAIRVAHRAGECGFAVIDFLQRIVVRDVSFGADKIEKCVFDLKQLAKELDIPIVVLAQLSRKVEEREDKTPKLSDLKGAGAIEEGADLVLMLHRPEYYQVGHRQYEADIVIGKQRSGARAGIIPVGFCGADSEFSDFVNRKLPDDTPFLR